MRDEPIDRKTEPIDEPEATEASVESARRQFLRKAGRFAAVTPPLIATMLAVTSTPALANGSGSSGGRPSGGSKGRGHKYGHSRGKGKGRGRSK